MKQESGVKQVRIPYAEWERVIIKKCVADYPNNLQYAFVIAAEKLPHRKVENINAYYYQTLKKQDTMITVGSKNGFTKSNVKNQHKSKETGKVTPDLQPIQWIIKELLNLTTKERNFIATFLTDTNKLLS